MLFSTPAFIFGFLPLCLTGFFAIGHILGRVRTNANALTAANIRISTRAHAWALRWLIAASLSFYAAWNPIHLPLLIGSIAANFALARQIQASQKPKAWLTLGITANLALLGWFKYADFFLHIVAPHAPDLRIALPLAISFFTFQQIMFLVDTARERSKPASPRTANLPTGPGTPPASTPPASAPPASAPTARLLPYAALVTFFPHLIAGPIVRPADIIPQLADPGMIRPDRDNLTDGLLIFLLGLAKKLILADMFGHFADIGFHAAAQGASLTFFEAWYATLAYALQIYFDFSGYSDMAIGLARMFNIRFPLNFNSPYQATNIQDFWRRWHITLGVFIRDYLYIPLGGNRTGPVRRIANLLGTMLLVGLWHGAAWNFVLWGGLHGIFLALHRLYRSVFPPMPAILGQIITLLAVILAWVPFRAGTLAATRAILAAMAGLHGIALPRMIVAALPPLHLLATPVPLLPYLGGAHTLSFPELTACLLLGWFIVLALPHVHQMTEPARYRALTASFTLSVQALFFAPHVVPFLYFQF